MADLGVIAEVVAIRHESDTGIAHVVLSVGKVLQVGQTLAGKLVGGTVELRDGMVMAAYAGDGNCVYAARDYVPPALAGRK